MTSTIAKVESSVIINTKDPMGIYCAYEHLAAFEPGKPPQVILVGSCKLADVYRLVDGLRNSEWCKIFQHGGSVMVKIIATGNDRIEMTRFATQHMRTFSDIPRCNLFGYASRSAGRALECVTNGEIYANQAAAAAALGLSASMISRHMRGDLKTVGGHVFRYKTSVE